MNNPVDLLSRCRYPDLPEPFAVGLREAVAYIITHFDAVGIIAAGSIIRGEGHANSDLDIHVLHHRPERQRIQKYFAGVPAEIFVNPPQRILGYFEEEHRDGQPSTAHMFATGFAVLDLDPFVQEAQRRAHELLTIPPTYSDFFITSQRYFAADMYENAMDIAPLDAASASMILSQAVLLMLRFDFIRRSVFIPRDKDLLRELQRQHPELGALSALFYTVPDFDQRLTLAGQIADLAIQTRGFFEWQSPPDPV